MPSTVPFFSLDREFAAHREAQLELLEQTLSHGKVLQGEEVGGLERQVADLSGQKYGIAVGSCTDALYFSLVAAGIEPGDEVLVTDFSFVASASAIVRARAVPVFVDIDESYNMDLGKAAAHVTPKTKALIFVHLYGQMGDPVQVEGFAEEHRLALIEDAAQAFGASHSGRMAGSLGSLSCLSFDPTKVIGAPGSGGMVLTDDEALAKEVSMLRYHGKNEDGEFEFLGYNSQMPSMTAALLSYKVEQNDTWLARRREIADYYCTNLGDHVQPPQEAENSTHIYHKFVIQSDERDALRKHLGEQNIKAMVHYDTPLHRHPYYGAYGYSDSDYPVVSKITERVLSLPVHPFLTDEEVERVVAAVNTFAQVHAVA